MYDHGATPRVAAALSRLSTPDPSTRCRAGALSPVQRHRLAKRQGARRPRRACGAGRQLLGRRASCLDPVRRSRRPNARSARPASASASLSRSLTSCSSGLCGLVACSLVSSAGVLRPIWSSSCRVVAVISLIGYFPSMCGVGRSRRPATLGWVRVGGWPVNSGGLAVLRWGWSAGGSSLSCATSRRVRPC
jgi:hypothetical protein